MATRDISPTWIERLFPSWALRREKARIQLVAAKRVYDAAKGTSYRVAPTDQRSPDAVMDNARDKVRKWARHLDENHDLSIGVLDVLVNNIVGTGITIEPMVMTKGGKPADKVNQAIRKALKDWSEKPEATGELPFGEAQRLLCRSWFRDGEALVRHLRARSFNHLTRVPYTIELMEADLLPFESLTDVRGVVHGVEKDAWGRPLAYHLYRQHPGNLLIVGRPLRTEDLVRVPAEDMIHVKFTRRVRQTRGVSVFHGVIRRLDDLKDYEESERIAARVAAALTAFIQKSEDYTGQAAAVSGDRSFEMQAGMIFDNLQAGESVGMIKSERPNTAMGEFIKSNQRALAAGTGTSYSSIAKDYNGTYSAQRQELVESQPAYKRLQEYFVAVTMRPIYREMVTAALATGQIPVSNRVDMDTLFDADMRSPAMPWIDPQKEMQAEVLAVENRFKSRTQVIRDHGGDPEVVYEQIKKERERDAEDGIGQFGTGNDNGSQGGNGAGNGSDADDGNGSGGDGGDGDGSAAAA